LPENGAADGGIGPSMVLNAVERQLIRGARPR
jgi:hypothetical protein